MPKIIEVGYLLTLEENYKHPSAFYIRNCLGNFIYFQTKCRATAQGWCNELYGVGFYKVNSGKTGKSSGTESAVGRLNTKSRMNSKGVR